jgi:hypothetical protein
MVCGFGLVENEEPMYEGTVMGFKEMKEDMLGKIQHYEADIKEADDKRTEIMKLLQSIDAKLDQLISRNSND